MRDGLRCKLRKISDSHSTPKNGVTGVTGDVSRHRTGVLHQPLHQSASKKTSAYQRCNTVTPVTPPKLEGREICNTAAGDTGGVTGHPSTGLQANHGSAVVPEDWFAFFDERAGIMEFDGGLDRAEAERRAMGETIAALGPKPMPHR